MQSAPSIDTRTSADSRPARAARGRLVTDAPMRMFHWLFALSFAGAYLTAESEHWRALHVALGYTLAGLLLFRILYGLIGPRHAGLAAMWRRLGSAPAWLRSLRHSRSLAAINWRQGQNLLMAMAVAALLLTVVPLTLSGYATYEEWGGRRVGESLEEVHEFFADAFLGVVLLHLALIAALSVLRRKNQALPMLSGRVDGPGPDLVRHDRRWLAAALLIGAIAFGTWVWPQAPAPDSLPSSSTRAQ